VILARTHDLHVAVEIADAGSGVFAANLEQALVVFP
jgi:hypothetical protein